MVKLKRIYTGIKNIIRDEGITNLISRWFVFLLRRTFWIENYYTIFIPALGLPEENEEDLLPKVDNVCSKIISTNKQADDLLAEGFTFGAYELNLRASLDKSALCFCLFVDKEFAHMSCMADNPRGKSIADPRPFDVDYQNKEVVIGRALTVPKFRRLHLRTYNGYLFTKYCKEKGVSRMLSSVNASSIPALSEFREAPDRNIKSKCRLIKVLWFKHLKEVRMEDITIRQMVAQMADGRSRRRTKKDRDFSSYRQP